MLVSCRIPMVVIYFKFTNDAEFKKYIKRQCEDLVLAYFATYDLTLRLLYGIQTSAVSGDVST